MCKGLNCCECFLFDWECLKEKANIPSHVSEDDPTLKFAVNSLHRQDIKNLLGKTCYEGICGRKKEEVKSIPFISGTYSIGQVVKYNDIYYKSLIDNNTSTPPSSDWQVCGLTTADKALIEKMQAWAGYLIEYYYRLRKPAGEIQNAGILNITPEDTATPTSGSVKAYLEVILGFAKTEMDEIKLFLKENAQDYPCYDVPYDCEEKKNTTTTSGGVGFIDIPTIK